MLKRLLMSLLLLTAVLNATAPTEDSVTKLYIATFDRAPDVDGLEYWLKSGLSLEDISASFFEQKETKEKYPDELDNEDFIIEIYANLFNRAPDSEGFDFWLKQLREGRVTRATFMLAVMDSAQGDDKKTLDNKTLDNNTEFGSTSQCAVVGSWLLTYDWNCDGTTRTINMNIYQDGRFAVGDGLAGMWSLQGYHYRGVYNMGTIYTGTVRSSCEHISGTMVEDDGDKGCWSASLRSREIDNEEKSSGGSSIEP